MNDLISRRKFLNLISAGLAGLAGAVVSVPILAYLLSPLLRPSPQRWLALGPVSQYEIGKTVEAAYEDPSPLPWAGQTARAAIWLRRTGQSSVIAFAVNCTHLGCPVSWQPDAQLFLCPCHGGVYDAEGRVAGGPPPLPLARYDTRIQDGNVEILTRPLPVIEEG
jgi:menaquinol-cytochrome c reductase iron-sulfur subunit